MFYGKVFMFCVTLCLGSCVCVSLQSSAYLASDYFQHKLISHVCVLSCDGLFYDQMLVKHLISKNLRVTMKLIEGDLNNIDAILRQWNVPVGVMINTACEQSGDVLFKASKLNAFDEAHAWLVIDADIDNSSFNHYIFDRLNLSIDTDVILASSNGNGYQLTDIYNFGKIQGNNLEKYSIGTWSLQNGLNISVKGFKYYDRWDFHNLTLRAVSVNLNRPKVFSPESLSDVRYTPGVTAMTKVVGQLLEVLRKIHNFRFNLTIAGRWVGSPARNSALAVTNSLFWREQDISYTCVRIYPQWLQWMDPFHPPATLLETKFYYLIPDTGIGEYDNQFLRPMSMEVWYCAGAAGCLCAVVLGIAAIAERRSQPSIYAVFSVLSAACQQAYDDGVKLIDEAVSSQARRLTIFVLGLMSMVMYNYYTSSVVSYLLNVKSPTISDIDEFIRSDFELVFENIGYTRSWLDNPGFYYYSGFVNKKEDELREAKVTKAKRTFPVLQTVEQGIKLVKSGGYAYHTEPYTANQVISRSFDESQLCKLGTLQMMPPSHVYIVGQKRSPYKQFFDWSLLRMLERGHISAARERMRGDILSCSGRLPQALTMGQAAPAFVLLLQAVVLAGVILVAEILWFRLKENRQ